MSASRRLAIVLEREITTQAPPDVCFRKARAADLDGLTAMSWHQAHFSIGNYMDFLNDPDRFMNVAVTGGRVIAFCMMYIVDGGRTAIGQAAHVLQDFRQRNIFKTLMDYSLLEVIRGRPLITRIIGISDADPYEVHLAKRNRWTETIEKKKFVLGGSASDIRFAISPSPMSKLIREKYPLNNVRLANARDVMHLFTTAHLRAHLFPGDVFIAGPDVFTPIAENIPTLMREERSHVVGLDKESFSTGYAYQCDLGLVLCVDLYGKMTTKMAVSHLLQHFPLALQHHHRGKVLIHCVLPECFNGEEEYRSMVEEGKILGLGLPSQRDLGTDKCVLVNFTLPPPDSKL